MMMTNKIFLFLALCIFLQNNCSDRVKWIKFDITYEYQTFSQGTKNTIILLEELNDSTGPALFGLFMHSYKGGYLFIPPHKKIDYYNYIKKDTLNLLVISQIIFNSDSVNKLIPEGERPFFLKEEKK